jgi:hypothetical protein
MALKPRCIYSKLSAARSRGSGYRKLAWVPESTEYKNKHGPAIQISYVNICEVFARAGSLKPLLLDLSAVAHLAPLNKK